MPPSPSERLASLGITLPPPPKPAGTYAPVVRDGSTAYVSGQVVLEGGQTVSPGRVDRDVDVASAQRVARTAVLQGLSALAESLGSIDRVQRILRVAVYVASSEGFVRQHEVANGATGVLVEIFGEAGRPARVSMGVASLPLNAPVEVELLASVQ